MRQEIIALSWTAGDRRVHVHRATRDSIFSNNDSNSDFSGEYGQASETPLTSRVDSSLTLSDHVDATRQ
jgi:hypothetical protein